MHKSRWVFCLWITIVVIGGVAFVFKMAEFAFTLLDPESNRFGGFGAVAIGDYLLGMLPLLFLTLWGVSKGHFHHIEQPKYRMLEMQREIDAEGNRVASQKPDPKRSTSE